jgi:hypothetical protein
MVILLTCPFYEKIEDFMSKKFKLGNPNGQVRGLNMR